jgi:hypothetical protein
MAIETEGQAQGDTAAQPPASGTPAGSGTAERQPAAATTPPALPDNRQYFDPKEHVPRSRLGEVTTRAQQREAALNAELAAERKKVQALSGVTPTSKEDEEWEAARTLLEKKYPGLAMLSDAQIVTKLQKIFDTSESIQANSDQQWQNQGIRSFKELEALAAKELKADLSPRGKRALRAAFIDYVQSDEEAGERYVTGDTDLIKEFWLDYQKSFIDPVRRSQNASVVERGSRLRMPRGGNSAANVPAVKKPDYTNEDSVHNGAWDAIKARLSAGD